MTKVRVLFHRSEGIPPRGLDETLAVEGCAEFYDGPMEASRLAFSLSRVGLGVQLHDDAGRRVATYADPARAIAHGFAHFDGSRRGHPRAMGGQCDPLPKAEPDQPALRYDPPERFIRALAAGAVAEMFDGPEDAPRLAFRMKSGGRAIHVVTPEGEIIGTFVTAMAAAVHGFRHLDRAAEQQSSDRPESLSGRRGCRGKVDVDG